MDGEERERKMLEDQIARARAAAGADEEEEKGLQRAEGEKVSLSLKPVADVTSASGSGSGSGSGSATPAASTSTSGMPKISFGAIGTSLGTASTPAANPLKINPLKRPAPTNVFKSAKAAKTSDAEPPAPKPKAFMSEAERLMKEDQARKAARAKMGYQGAGPRR